MLDDAELLALLACYGRSVTCVSFMGGDAEPQEIARLAGDGAEEPTRRCARDGIRGATNCRRASTSAAFDYVKLGGWIEALGPLTAPTTNQRLYKVGPDGTEWRTSRSRFRRKP